MCGFLRGFNELTHVNTCKALRTCLAIVSTQKKKKLLSLLLLLSGVATMRPYYADVLLHNTAPLYYHFVKPRSDKYNFVNGSAQAFIFSEAST